jgi:hypothetical protein
MINRLRILSMLLVVFGLLGSHTPSDAHNRGCNKRTTNCQDDGEGKQEGKGSNSNGDQPSGSGQGQR